MLFPLSEVPLEFRRGLEIFSEFKKMFTVSVRIFGKSFASGGGGALRKFCFQRDQLGIERRTSCQKGLWVIISLFSSIFLSFAVYYFLIFKGWLSSFGGKNPRPAAEKPISWSAHHPPPPRMNESQVSPPGDSPRIS